MKGILDNELGRVSIDPEVIAQYAGSTAIECFGIVGMAAVSMKDGLVKLLRGDSLTRGIKVDIDEDNSESENDDYDFFGDDSDEDEESSFIPTQ